MNSPALAEIFAQRQNPFLGKITADKTLPENWFMGTFVGRVWRPDKGGPAIVKLDKDGSVVDITSTFPTMSILCAHKDPVRAVHEARGNRIGHVSEVLGNTPLADNIGNQPFLLPPIDLQAIKAAGVTFPVSMLQRIVEEAAGGDPAKAKAIELEIAGIVGGSFESVKPGTPEALAMIEQLVEKTGRPRHYIEVALGTDAEIFTKAQPMSAVGHGMAAGVYPDSTWNNPEPEVVLIVPPSGEIIGATLGNDVNLRDIEGRSALLLGEAKDRNASCSVGPFIRLFDHSFTLDHVRNMQVKLRIDGPDGFELDDQSLMEKIKRDPANLAAQLVSPHHQYPSGSALFCGTMFAPTKDRDEPDKGFTHKTGDIVTISSRELGSLTNIIVPTDTAPRWGYGVERLMANLYSRGHGEAMAAIAEGSRAGEFQLEYEG